MPIRSARVPIVPGAILFDLLNGGDKNWGRYPPYRELGHEAAAAAADTFALGSVGAGLGATTLNLKGGLGSASATVRGFTVGALAAVNAAGSVTIGRRSLVLGGSLRARQRVRRNSVLRHRCRGRTGLSTKNRPGENSTLVVVACDAALTKTQAHRLAIMAQVGVARAIRPVHTPLDGDLVFAAATGSRPLGDPIADLADLGAVAADVTARAIARAVYEADALPFPRANRIGATLSPQRRALTQCLGVSGAN